MHNCPQCAAEGALGTDALAACMTCGEMMIAGVSVPMLPAIAVGVTVVVASMMLRRLRINKVAAKLATN